MNKETKINWPVYKDRMLILGNPKSQVAVCALWTKKELVAEKLNLDKISVIGNLYSPKRGISFLVRNILANPKIRYLIICGSDTSKSGQVLVDLATNGFKKAKDKENNRIYWQIVSDVENRPEVQIQEIYDVAQADPINEIAGGASQGQSQRSVEPQTELSGPRAKQYEDYHYHGRQYRQGDGATREQAEGSPGIMLERKT